MSYLIDRDLCISCGICAAECPVDAIVQEKNHIGSTYLSAPAAESAPRFVP